MYLLIYHSGISEIFFFHFLFSCSQFFHLRNNISQSWPHRRTVTTGRVFFGQQFRSFITISLKLVYYKTIWSTVSVSPKMAAVGSCMVAHFAAPLKPIVSVAVELRDTLLRAAPSIMFWLTSSSSTLTAAPFLLCGGSDWTPKSVAG